MNELVELKVRTNFGELFEWLEKLGTRQVPFATAKALTVTARDVRDQVRADLPKHFKLRSSWVSGGIRFQPASKSDWPHSVAYAGSRDQFMELQETGGRKVPAKGARNVAIPTEATVRRRGSSGRLPTSAKPRALLDRKDTFVADHVLRRRLRGKRPGTESLALFLFRPEAKIQPRFEFRKTAEATVLRVYAKNFAAAFQAAITAPRKPGRLK